MARPVNAAGMALIKSYETFRACPYQDEGEVWTIGYGHTHAVNAETPPVSEPEACAILQADLADFGNYVLLHIKVPLSDNEYAALVSLTENVGTGPLVDTLGKKLNAGDRAGAADEFLRWDKEHIDGELVEIDGLARRRGEERELFLTPDDEPASHNID